MKKERTKSKTVGVVTLYRVGDMTKAGRRSVSRWLERLAGDIEQEPSIFSKTFRARLMYDEKGG